MFEIHDLEGLREHYLSAYSIFGETAALILFEDAVRHFSPASTLAVCRPAHLGSYLDNSATYAA